MATARVISSVHNMNVTGCPELSEINFGKLEGLQFAEINDRFPEVARMWVQRSPELAYPGGESLDQLEKRVKEFINRLVQHTGDTVLVVAHAGVLRT
jgi:broad specificity phosphatase PhoE